jgi:hypothetical protein
MKIGISIENQLLSGTKPVSFEVYDSNGNIGTLKIGKAGIRWQEPKATVYEQAKSWNEVIKWLREHGRTLRK